MFTKQGFTLIELLAVVLIIAILAAIALPVYTKAVEKSRAAEGITLVRSIAGANEVFRLSNGHYSEDILDLILSFPGQDCVESNRNCKITKFYTLRSQGIGHPQSTALARRIGKPYFFIYYPADGGPIRCGYDNSEGEGVCKYFSAEKAGNFYMVK